MTCEKLGGIQRRGGGHTGSDLGIGSGTGISLRIVIVRFDIQTVIRRSGENEFNHGGVADGYGSGAIIGDNGSTLRRTGNHAEGPLHSVAFEGSYVSQATSVGRRKNGGNPMG